MTEYPLFTQTACDLCPTARYVGGTSRWLCECPEPKQCRGVVYSQKRTAIVDELIAGGIKFSSVERAAGLISHNDYYAQFVTEGLMNYVANRIGVDKLSNTKNPNLNDIPMKLWDSLGSVAGKAGLLRLSESMTYSNLTLGSLSISQWTCLNKAAARMWIWANVPQAQHNIRVEYRDDTIEHGNRCRSFETLMVGNIATINDHYINTSEWNDDPLNIKFLGAYII